MTDRPLRVLRLLSHLGTGGTEKQCLEVLAWFRDHGHRHGVRVDLATYCTDPFTHVLPVPPGVRWYRLDRPWTPLGALRAARALRPLLRRYDVLHALLWPSVYVARLARPSVPVVASVHNTHQPAGPLGLKRRLDRLAFRGTKVVFNSEAGRRALAEALGVPEGEAAVVPNGKRPYEGPQGPRTGVVCVARRSPQKRHDLVLDALASMSAEERASVRPVRFVGQGTDAPEFRAQVASRGLSDLVVCHGEVEDVMPLVAEAALLALPTEHEGMPNVVLEAWNAGTPVLASRVPGVSELVRDGRDARLVDNTVPAWAQALRELAADPARRRALAEAGRGRLSAEFSLEAACRRWIEVYRDAALRPTQV